MRNFVFCILAIWISVAGSARSRINCRQELLTECTDPLQVITNNRDLGFATSREEFNVMCPKLLGGLHCINNYSRECLHSEHRQFFHMLYEGTEQVIKDLCLDTKYQNEYLMHSSCMRSVQAGYERCAAVYQEEVYAAGSNKDADVYDEDVIQTTRKLCCSFRTYLACSQREVRSRCGDDTSVFTRSFLDRMAGPLVQGYCMAFEPSYSCSSDIDETVDYDNGLSREATDGLELESSSVGIDISFWTVAALSTILAFGV